MSYFEHQDVPSASFLLPTADQHPALKCTSKLTAHPFTAVIIIFRYSGKVFGCDTNSFTRVGNPEGRKSLERYICSQSNKIHNVFNDWVLFITYVTSTCFGLHRSIIRIVLQALFADLVRVLPHTKSTNTACKTLLMMDR